MRSPTTESPSSSTFWVNFHPLIPEAIRCRFFATAMDASDGRATECSRESGPFLHAIESMHWPRAIIRLRLLKKVAEALAEFCGETDEMIRNTKGPLGEVMSIVASFEEEIVMRFQDASKRNDEIYAREIMPVVEKAAIEIARRAESSFEKAVRDLEVVVAKSLMYSDILQSREVSAVSLDLAQYGRHASIIYNYAEAEGIYALNRKIRDEIERVLDIEGISASEVSIINTGDGALMIFHSTLGSTAEKAMRFSEEFLKSFNQQNDRLDRDNQLHFRFGICSGIVAMQQSRVRGTEISQCYAGGLSLGVAVRLQSAAKTGEILASRATWDQLPELYQRKFGEEQSISGKVHEKAQIPARRYQCVPPILDESNG